MPTPVPGTTWVITGTPNAAITTTESTQDGVTMIGTPPIDPRVTPAELLNRRWDECGDDRSAGGVGRARRGSDRGSGGTPEG